MRESAFVRPRRRRSSARRQAILSDDPQWHVRWPRVAPDRQRGPRGTDFHMRQGRDSPCGRLPTRVPQSRSCDQSGVMQPQWFGNGSADPPTRIQRAEWALEHQSAATPQFAGDFALHRLAEIRNLSRFSVFEPQQYSRKGGFAGSGSADHRKALPERTSISTSCST